MFAMQQEKFFKGSPGAAAPWGIRWLEGSLWHIAWSAQWRALPGSQGPLTGTEVAVAGASGTLPLPPYHCAPRFQVNFLKGEFFLSIGT